MVVVQLCGLGAILSSSKEETTPEEEIINENPLKKEDVSGSKVQGSYEQTKHIEISLASIRIQLTQTYFNKF